MRVTLSLLFFFLSTFSVAAQWQVVTVPKVSPPLQRAPSRQTLSTARTQDTVYHRTPLSIPFWDDFSKSNVPYYPDTLRWVYSQSVSWNKGVGVNPPSIGVVTFNGLDSLGIPYDVTNNLAKGFGDKLVSWPIDLSTVPEADRSSVFVSFFYEYQGHGELPDNGDYLVVELKNDSGEWVQPFGAQITVDSLAKLDSLGQPAYDTGKFKGKTVQISDPHFFHDQFQFRIRSFGRISGPWDTWNVDYVYLNRYQKANYVSFPDRTVVQPTSSVLGDYWSIPARHFHESSDTALFVPPTTVVHNARQKSQTGVTYHPQYFIREYKSGALESAKTLSYPNPTDTAGWDILLANQVAGLQANEFRTSVIDQLPAKSDFTTDSDSIVLTLQYAFNTGDRHSVGPAGLDYTANFLPLDFRVNDTIYTTQTLTDYYAYDDGSAEFAAGLNQPGTEMAYRFDMKTDSVDNLYGVDLYFPNVGDQSSQTIILTVRKDTSTTGTLYSDTLIVQRSAFDKFLFQKFYRNIHVQDHFYIGWVQTSSVLIAVGLDASHDTADRIFYNTGGQWLSHPSLYGSLMIRPRLNGNVVTGLNEEPVEFEVYPNPNTGSFYLTNNPDSYAILDFTGQSVSSTKEILPDGARVTITDPSAGLYLIKARLNGKSITRRIIVQGPSR